jgi:hypothetical protein
LHQLTVIGFGRDAEQISGNDTESSTEFGRIEVELRMAASSQRSLCVPKIRFDVDAGSGRGKLAA